MNSGTSGIRIQGDATINGVNTMRVGKLLAGLHDTEATENELAIAVEVAKKVRKLITKGYSEKHQAAYARRLVQELALKLG